ncbi:MAG: hypothetical protein KJ000_03075 [Pirellulaceae bacterium]|nr:hypothetical protein [Pirellulaceae bacterium]
MLELLLDSDADLFCKIDSDDVYFRGYLPAIVAQIELLGLRERTTAGSARPSGSLPAHWTPSPKNYPEVNALNLRAPPQKQIPI